jgi:aromatic ring-opening dioxygenase catalytic subunit (LigB family)
MDWTMGPADTWHRMGRWLGQLGESIGAVPKGIVVISAHWEEEEFTVTSHAHPPLIYDYYGFPEHTYRIKYDAPGSPLLAQRIIESLTNAGIPARSNSDRGFDHGVFIPFKLIYPNADIPIVQLSLKAGLNPSAHLEMGRALQPLRGEGVLIVGSGMSYHNLRGFGAQFGPLSDQFDRWLTETVSAPESKLRDGRLSQWKLAPGARQAHPREEHLLPLMVISGAAEEEGGRQVFTDRVIGVTVSGYQFGLSE